MTGARDSFEAVTALLGADLNGLSLERLAVAHAIARELAAGAPDQDRLDQLCRKAGTRARRLRDHLVNRRPSPAGEQLDLLGTETDDRAA